MKKIITLILCLTMTFSLVACDIPMLCQHRDEDDDSLCDKCEEEYTDGIDIPICQHRDADDDSFCDECEEEYTDGIDIPICQHRDTDDNGMCDKCRELYRDGTDIPICQHRDKNDDLFCDKCDERYIDGEDNAVPPGVGPGVQDTDPWWYDITYSKTQLIFQMTDCSNKQELESGCRRYLSGEKPGDRDIDRYVAERNTNAYINTGVTVKYNYYPEDEANTHGFSKNITLITEECMNRTDASADMYCNFMTDLFVCSLKGSFANLHSELHGEGRYAGKNYFDFSDSGYMGELMSSLSLAGDKMYILASDYFIDLIRASYVVPVSVDLYNSIAPDMVADLNGDGAQDINDFFCEVKNGDWTYDRLLQYSAKIHKGTGDAGADETILDDKLGFALADNSIPATALIYTSKANIINKEWDSVNEVYSYSYPDENPVLFDVVDAIGRLVQGTGVMYVRGTDAAKVSEVTPLLGIRNRFTGNHILFGGIVLLGSLEYSPYQDMKDDEIGGFGVVPVPVYEKEQGDAIATQYKTQIHTAGRAGAIAKRTDKFVQCSAFLQYQSSNSTHMLNEYYDYNLTFEITDGLDGNIEMIKYIRNNVGNSFDRLFEDTIAFVSQDQSPELDKDRFHARLVGDAAYVIDIRDVYEKVLPVKRDALSKLVVDYEMLPV